MYKKLIINSLFYFAVITVGFERESYLFREPSAGSSPESICAVLISGTLGLDLIVRPLWSPVTATGIDPQAQSGLSIECYLLCDW